MRRSVTRAGDTAGNVRRRAARGRRAREMGDMVTTGIREVVVVVVVVVCGTVWDEGRRRRRRRRRGVVDEAVLQGQTLIPSHKQFFFLFFPFFFCFFSLEGAIEVRGQQEAGEIGAGGPAAEGGAEVAQGILVVVEGEPGRLRHGVEQSLIDIPTARCLDG
ncbi:hypothetical protein VTO42DRAFT_4072 [Malbranchea cinnamomea]